MLTLCWAVLALNIAPVVRHYPRFNTAPRIVASVADEAAPPESPPIASSAPNTFPAQPKEVNLPDLPEILTIDEWMSTIRAASNWSAAADIARTALRRAPPPRLGVGELVPLQPLFTHAIASCADASEWETGIELLRELERSGRVVSPSVYTEAIRGCGEGGDWSAAVALLHRARSRGDMAGSQSVTVGMYASAISACDAAGKHDEALQLYKLGFDAKCFDHWHKDEAFSIDLHGFTQACAACAVRYVLNHELGNFLPCDLKIITGSGTHSEGGESRYAAGMHRRTQTPPHTRAMHTPPHTRETPPLFSRFSLLTLLLCNTRVLPLHTGSARASSASSPPS